MSDTDDNAKADNDKVVYVKKSIPKETDLIESTLAGAIKASVKRLQIHSNDEAEETPQDQAVSISQQSPENDSDVIHFPKAG